LIRAGILAGKIELGMSLDDVRVCIKGKGRIDQAGSLGSSGESHGQWNLFRRFGTKPIASLYFENGLLNSWQNLAGRNETAHASEETKTTSDHLGSKGVEEEVEPSIKRLPPSDAYVAEDQADLRQTAGIESVPAKTHESKEDLEGSALAAATYVLPKPPPLQPSAVAEERNASKSRVVPKKYTPAYAPKQSSDRSRRQGDGVGLGLFVIVLLVIGCGGIYFLPTIIAGGRNHQNLSAILILNLLVGWTFVGYVIALVWSFTAQARRD